jgi:phage terminase small subunit
MGAFLLQLTAEAQPAPAMAGYTMAILKNAKYEHFAQLIVKGVNATEAAIGAGYGEKRAHISGCELLKNPKVSVRITELSALVSERVTEKTGIDKAWVMNQLVEVVSMAKAAEPVLDSEGNPTGEYKQNLGAANKALELIGKEFAMFVDRKEIRTGPLDDLEHDQLKALNEAIAALSEPSGFVASGSNSTRH